MTTRALLLLKKHRPTLQGGDAPLEWLVTNGLGGYASGSVDGPPTRRFHGLLVAAHPAPVGRVLLLHALEEVVELPDGRAGCLRPGRDADPPPIGRMDFCIQAGLPQWTFELQEGACIEQSVMMPNGQNTVHLRYRLTGSVPSVTLRLKPWLDFRPHEGLLTPEQSRSYVGAGVAPACYEFKRADDPLVLRLQVTGADASALTPAPDNWNLVPYAVEEDRGYEHLGSMHSPGTVSVTLTEGEDVFLSASTETWEQMAALSPTAAFELEWTRRERLLASSDEALQLPDTFLLPLAADQFIVRPATRVRDEAQARAVGADARTVIAGYHWFTDWGRDTMISLEGLALVTGRHHEARDILRTFGLHVRNGLIPNLFPEGEREGLYHTADATMWFFHALHRYDTVTGDRSLVDELLPALEEIVQRHREGTLFNIHVDADGLLTQGADGVQLTWMDALVDGWVVTPRRGKPVEINALWHNALVLLASWMVRAGRGMLAEDIAREAHRCRESFNARFWNASRQRLYDVVDGERGDDDACRPNQVVALAVTHSPLERDYWEPVLNSVASELLTPVGLRTLSPAHPDYKRRYFGDLRSRDAAYHQGTVWPWLIGSFIDAWLVVHPDDAGGARTLLSPLLAHVTSAASMGSISEIFDAEAPFTARGCVAQAWSVAEVSRALVKLAARGRAPAADAAGT
jgi:predicted glycogen debranching enzyme